MGEKVGGLEWWGDVCIKGGMEWLFGVNGKKGKERLVRRGEKVNKVVKWVISGRERRGRGGDKGNKVEDL